MTGGSVDLFLGFDFEFLDEQGVRVTEHYVCIGGKGEKLIWSWQVDMEGE